jgi:hypothetical protein
VVQFDATRRTLPRLERLVVPLLKGRGIRKKANRGAAWLSSARVVRCWVKSRNERNPCPVLLPVREDSQETAVDNAEEGGDDVKSSWPLCLGLHTCYNGIEQREAIQQCGANP